MAKRPPNIPDSELEVLKVLWSKSKATVREALDQLQSAGKNWSYATVATLLDRLTAKGMVSCDRMGTAFVFAPLVTAEEVQQKKLQNLIDHLYQGEPGLLVLHLLKSHRLEPQQTQEVRQILQGMTEPAPNLSPKRKKSDSAC